MEKLIIENRTGLPILEVIEYVLEVIDKGKISETSKGEQYCFMSMYKDGIIVYAEKNKKSDRLIINRR